MANVVKQMVIYADRDASEVPARAPAGAKYIVIVWGGLKRVSDWTHGCILVHIHIEENRNERRAEMRESCSRV